MISVEKEIVSGAPSQSGLSRIIGIGAGTELHLFREKRSFRAKRAFSPFGGPPKGPLEKWP
jgi:hypothetical protein